MIGAGAHELLGHFAGAAVMDAAVVGATVMDTPVMDTPVIVTAVVNTAVVGAAVMDAAVIEPAVGLLSAVLALTGNTDIIDTDQARAALIIVDAW